MKNVMMAAAAVLSLSLLLTSCAGTKTESTAEKTAAPVTESTAPQATAENTDPVIIRTQEAPGANTPTEEETTKEQTESAPEETGAASLSAADFVIVYKGMELHVGETFDEAPAREKLGTAMIEQGQACIGGGYDTNYYYEDGVVGVMTVAKDGAQLI